MKSDFVGDGLLLFGHATALPATGSHSLPCRRFATPRRPEMMGADDHWSPLRRSHLITFRDVEGVAKRRHGSEWLPVAGRAVA